MVAEGLVDAIGDGVGGDVGKGDEEGPFNEEDTDGSEGEDFILEDAIIGEDIFGFYFTLRRGKDKRVRAYEEVGEGEKEEEYEGENSDGPFKADEGEESLEHEGEDNT